MTFLYIIIEYINESDLDENFRELQFPESVLLFSLPNNGFRHQPYGIKMPLSTAKITVSEIYYKLILLLTFFVFIDNWVSIFIWLLFILLGGAHLSTRLEAHTIKVSKSSFCLLMILIAISISLFLNWASIISFPMTLLRSSYWLSAWLLVSFIIPSLNLKKRHIKRILYVFLFSVGISTVIGLIYLKTVYYIPFWQRYPPHLTRACGMYISTMAYAYNISLVCTFLLSLLISDQLGPIVKTKKFIFIIFLIAFGGLFYSGSRGAIIGFLCSLPFCLVPQWRGVNLYRKLKMLFFSLIALFFITGVMASIIYSDFLGAYAPKNVGHFSIGRFTQDDYFQKSPRIGQYRGAIEVAKKNPIFGAGFRNTERKIDAEKKRYEFGQIDLTSHAHNNYLEILSAIGIFGFIPFLLFFLFWYKESGINKNIRAITLPVLVNFAIISLFQSTINDSIGLFLIIMFYSISQYARKHRLQPIRRIRGRALHNP